MTESDQKYSHSDYTVGWICALPESELVVASTMLDKEHPVLPAADNDANVYYLGSIGSHNVVIACLPAAITGKAAAAAVAKDMLRTFNAIRFSLLVGVGGAAPYFGNPSNATANGEGSDDEENSDDEESEEVRDIRLGDVAISLHTEYSEAVLQYGFGKSVQGGKFCRKGTLNRPPYILLSAVAKLKSKHIRKGHRLQEHLSKMIADHPRLAPKFEYQGASKDQLFLAEFIHQEDKKSCKSCCGLHNVNLVKRKRRADTSPVLHYGTIGSADQVMKDSVLRDRWAESNNIICFEMEAAGLMDSFPCLVIRGICDYADSHNNKRWQPYAAATAAAYAKELLAVVPATDVTRLPAINIEVMEKLSVVLAENTAAAQNVEKGVMTAEEKSILDWLSSINFSKPQNSAIKSQTEGTGNWLLEDNRYTSWRDSSSGLLWLYGVVGCGKTVLCSVAIQDIQNYCRREPTKKMAYWYFQFNDVNTQDICNMLQSLMRQLGSSPVSKSIRNLSEQHQKVGSKPSIRELINAVWSIIEGLKQDIFLVIDALDELPQSKRPELFDFLNQLPDRGASKIHILITSRPESDISSKLNQISSVSIDIEHLVKQDIRLFVEAALTDNKLCKFQDLHEEILNRLTAHNEIRFRWAELQITRFKECLDKQELIRALQTIPHSLEETYAKVLEKIPDGRRERVRSVLMWLTSSLRPMTVEEIADVASCEYPEKLLENVLTSLLITLIDETDKKTIKLAHSSVKEYLITTERPIDEGLWYKFTNEQAHIVISERAVYHLLNMNDVTELEKAKMVKSLLTYYAEFWPQHAASIVNYQQKDATELQRKIDKLFTSADAFKSWLQMHDPDKPRHYVAYKRSTRPLYYASLLGFGTTVTLLLENQSQLPLNEGRYENPINAAAIMGHFEIVKCLQEHFCKDRSFASLELIAEDIEREVTKTLTILLERKEGTLIGHEVVEAAARNRRSGEEVLAFLLEKRGGDVVITEEVLKAAAENKESGREVMALLLEKRGPDVVITEKVVKAAARNWPSGNEVMALLLEKRGADVMITEEVVKAAAENRRSGNEVMTFLLEKRGADVVITEEVVRMIARVFSREVMTLLLEKRGADVVITEVVVKAAAENRRSGNEVMALLLEKRGVDVVITEEVVKAAAGNWRSGNEVMALLLEKRGADVVITEEVVKVAAGNWRSGNEVMTLLLEKRGADVVITEEVVKAAAENEESGGEVMALLLKYRGADVVITEEVVKAAAGNQGSGNKVMALLLEKRGPDVVITEEVVKAVAGNWRSGNEVMALLLEKRGVDVVITEEVVKAAAGNQGSGHELIALLLQKRGADVVITEEVVKAVAGNWERRNEVMALLLEKRGGDVVIAEEVVKAAAKSEEGVREVMTLLLKHRGADVVITNDVVNAARK